MEHRKELPSKRMLLERAKEMERCFVGKSEDAFIAGFMVGFEHGVGFERNLWTPEKKV